MLNDHQGICVGGFRRGKMYWADVDGRGRATFGGNVPPRLRKEFKAMARRKRLYLAERRDYFKLHPEKLHGPTGPTG